MGDAKFKLTATIVAVFLTLVVLDYAFERYEDNVSAEAAATRKSPIPLEGHVGPGSGHGFGFGIEYTVRGHAEFNGVWHAIVSSAARGEEHVEIWTPLEDVVALPVGSAFEFDSPDIQGGWKPSLRVTKRPTLPDR